MPVPRSSALGTTFLVGGLLLLALVLVAVFAPFWGCPECDVSIAKSVGIPNSDCETCRGKDKMSLYKRWKTIHILKENGYPPVHLFH